MEVSVRSRYNDLVKFVEDEANSLRTRGVAEGQAATFGVNLKEVQLEEMPFRLCFLSVFCRRGVLVCLYEINSPWQSLSL